MPYDEARQLITQADWMPAHVKRSDLDAEYARPKFYYAAGYSEVVACSGTGVGYCAFKFYNTNNQYLRVTTRGGDYRPDGANSPRVVYAEISDDFD